VSADAASETTVTPQGRVTIPAALRREAGIEVGDTVIVHVEDGRVVVETRDQLAARTRRDVARAGVGGSVVDELLAERRADAARDQAG
jgi:AbrB family looped-hinge helix DNA binding protein